MDERWSSHRGPFGVEKKNKTGIMPYASLIFIQNKTNFFVTKNQSLLLRLNNHRSDDHMAKKCWIVVKTTCMIS